MWIWRYTCTSINENCLFFSWQFSATALPVARESCGEDPGSNDSLLGGNFIFGLLGYTLGVSENGGTPKSSILIGFSTINHPFWGTPNFWKHRLVNLSFCLIFCCSSTVFVVFCCFQCLVFETFVDAILDQMYVQNIFEISFRPSQANWNLGEKHRSRASV